MEPNDVVLYHGSLNELNSRAKDNVERYRFSPAASFISGFYKYDAEIRDELCRLNLAGIVNRKTLFNKDNSRMAVEGTPIGLKKLDD